MHWLKKYVKVFLGFYVSKLNTLLSVCIMLKLNPSINKQDLIMLH